ncbi:histone deacetylase family protein [Nitratireductor sp. CH_MIT9313-5]|uniref:histone deacetylase family protein n=1 Tax=Nitratireductor sp. CH_MIT9313-5 TaxID=3107764 RepID=UPI0030091BF6
MVTRIFTHSDCLEHDTPLGHPERADRLRAIEKVLSHDIFDPLERFEAPLADEDAILLAHPQEYRQRVKQAIPAEGRAKIDEDTSVSPRSMDAALRAIGGATAAVDAVFNRECDNAFVATRPPGHHAEKNRAMGFCLFNNAAIAARHAQQQHGAERVAIIDWDVHHGNGTQDIFWDDPSVLYCSTHEMPLYPGTGAESETGAGNICNVPLRRGDGGVAFRDAMDSVILPRLVQFSPDLIIISAGFDAHYRDPLAELTFTEDDFSWATAELMDKAARFCSNRIVSVLEGGYDLEGLALSVAAHVGRLMKG